ncbi:MAG: sugar phosphate nucleotidyltransferase, partial [Candidatus Binatia bacterium]
LHKRCPDATVVLFPSDHFILEEDLFIDHVRLAVHAVQQAPSQTVLLAMEAKWAETEYGYVVPADSIGHIDLYGCRRAAHFVEKPDVEEARLLVAAGALWNTMIMVFKVETLFCQIQTLFPDVATQFSALAKVIGTKAEKRKLRKIYLQLRPLNFSKEILEKIAVRFPGAISVLPVLQVTWSDWGSPQRLIEMKESIARPAGPTRPPQHLPLPLGGRPSPKAALP